MKKSDITIVIPTYNRKNYLKECIESALNQTVSSEIIVCDHGSTDGTVEMMEKYKTKVKYVRSLSFIQGTLVNLLRNMILLLMLYLIFAGRISVGEFFSLFIYSFFIFGPLQELGNIINVYRETEVSLDNFKAILNTPKEKKPENPVALGRVNSLKFNEVSFKELVALAESNRLETNDVLFKQLKLKG
jgi:ATP-binding cassette subfamily B protein